MKKEQVVVPEEDDVKHFRQGDTVWWEPTDPEILKDPLKRKQAGWLGKVNYDTGNALLLMFNEAREEYGQLVPIAELRRRSIT